MGHHVAVVSFTFVRPRVQTDSTARASRFVVMKYMQYDSFPALRSESRTELILICDAKDRCSVLSSDGPQALVLDEFRQFDTMSTAFGASEYTRNLNFGGCICWVC